MTKAKGVESTLFGPEQAKQEPKPAKPKVAKKRKRAAKPEPAKTTKQEIVPASKLPARVVATFDPIKVMESIERMASNPAVDTAKLGAVLAFQKEVMAINSKISFDEAMILMRPNLPIFAKDGTLKIDAREKNTAPGGRTKAQATKYAKWETVQPILEPILAQHGFTLWHEVGTPIEGKDKITIEAILEGHGHTRRGGAMAFPYDIGGSKNVTQAVVSASSYGKRVTSFLILNIVARDEDDDGRRASKPGMVGEAMNTEEVERLIELSAAAELPEPRLMKYLNERRPKGHPEAEAIKDLPRDRYQDVVDAVQVWENARAQVQKEQPDGSQNAAR